MKCFECYSYAYHGDSGFPTMGKNMAIGLNVDRIGAVILPNFLCMCFMLKILICDVAVPLSKVFIMGLLIDNSFTFLIMFLMLSSKNINYLTYFHVLG